MINGNNKYAMVLLNTMLLAADWRERARFQLKACLLVSYYRVLQCNIAGYRNCSVGTRICTRLYAIIKARS